MYKMEPLLPQEHSDLTALSNLKYLIIVHMKHHKHGLNHKSLNGTEELSASNKWDMILLCVITNITITQQSKEFIHFFNQINLHLI